MVYGFHFELPGELIYYEGCKVEDEARTKLEKMAKEYCRNGKKGIGEILFMKNRKFEKISRYEYSFEDGELIINELD